MGAHKELFTEWLDRWAAPEVKELPILGQQLAYARWLHDRELTVWTEFPTDEQIIIADMNHYTNKSKGDTHEPQN